MLFWRRRMADESQHAMPPARHVERRAAHASHQHPAQDHPAATALGLSVLVLLIAIAWLPLRHITLANLLEQARPAGTLPDQRAALLSLVWPSEHASHVAAIKIPATWIAFSTALAGFILATMFYGTRQLDAAQAQQAFAPIYRCLWNKWWFDELYDRLLVRPTLAISGWVAQLDRRWIDGFIDGLARWTRAFSSFWDWIADRTVVDGLINLTGQRLHDLGLSLRRFETGKLRQYVMFLALGTVLVFVLTSFWRYALAQ
jgi:NADH-quinone oxidoreductase subunit L